MKSNVIHANFGPSAFALFKEACTVDDRDPEEGIRLYRRVIRVDPKCDEAMANLGRVYFRLKEFGTAETWWKRAIETNPRAVDAYYNLGYLRLIQGNYRAAVANFEMSVGIEPDFAGAYYNLAEALGKLGRRDESRACLRMHIRLRGAWSVEARALLGMQLIQGGK